MSNLTDLAYNDRRAIILTSVAGEPAQALSPNLRKGMAGAAGLSAGALIGTAIFPGVGTLIGSAVASLLTGAAVAAAVTSTSASNPGKPLPEGTILVPQETALRDLSFPPGHPIPGHVYAGHPLVPNKYIPLDVFHQYLFEEKANELVDLLASLGATWVRVSYSKGYSRAGSMGVGIDYEAISVGVSGGGHSKEKQHILFEEHYRPKGEPQVPEHLVWLGHEPSWQRLAERRLKYNTARFQVELQYENDFGFNAEFGAKCLTYGGKLSGEYKEFRATQWTFEGEFA